MFGFIRKMFFGLVNSSGSLTSIANVFNFKTCISLNNQPCMTRPTLTDSNPDEYNQGLRY